MPPSLSRPVTRRVPHPSRLVRRVGLGSLLRRLGLKPRREASRAIWALAPEDSALVFLFGHATNPLNLRVPHPSRFLRRVGSYAPTPQSLFSSLLGLPRVCFCRGRALLDPISAKCKHFCHSERSEAFFSIARFLKDESVFSGALRFCRSRDSARPTFRLN